MYMQKVVDDQKNDAIDDTDKIGTHHPIGARLLAVKIAQAFTVLFPNCPWAQIKTRQ
jgi:hypothetical protein